MIINAIHCYITIIQFIIVVLQSEKSTNLHFTLIGNTNQIAHTDDQSEDSSNSDHSIGSFRVRRSAEECMMICIRCFLDGYVYSMKKCVDECNDGNAPTCG